MRFRTFKDVLSLWPRTTDLIKDVNVPYDNARQWRVHDTIPSWHWQSVLRTKRAKAAGLTADTLVKIAARG